jgi:hypothetical protein
MAELGIDLDRNWTVQPEAIKTDVIEVVSTVLFSSNPQIQAEYPSLNQESRVPVITFACQTVIHKNQLADKAARRKEKKNVATEAPRKRGSVGRGSNLTKSRKERASWQAERIVIRCSDLFNWRGKSRARKMRYACIQVLRVASRHIFRRLMELNVRKIPSKISSLCTYYIRLRI